MTRWLREPEDWFSVVRLGGGVHLISEPGHVNMFLVQGVERALLIDSGLGIADVAAVTRKLTSLPVTVVNTHHHLDHRGGNASFDEVIVHASAVPELRSGFTGADLAWFPGYAKELCEAFATGERGDENYLHHYDRALIPRTPPSAEEFAAYAVPPCRPSGTVSDGDAIDLGGRVVRVIHCPGHSPDSIVLYDDLTQTVFAGDVLVAGVSYAHLPGAEPEVFAASISRLRRLTPDRRRILLAHTMRYEQPADFLDEVDAGWRDVLAGDVVWRDWHDMFANPCRRADFRRFSITVA